MTMNRIVTSLLLRRPFYGYILSSLRLERKAGIEGMESIYDGPSVRLLYDPVWLETLPQNRAFGAVIHELLHIVLMHPFRRNGREPALWAIATDLAVNEHLDPAILPDKALTVERLNREPGITLEAGGSAESYYASLAALRDEGSFGFIPLKKQVMVRFPDERESLIRINEDAELSEINRKTVQHSLEALTLQAAQEGEIPGALGDHLTGVYRRLEVNWRNVLKKFLTGKGRMRQHKTVKRLSKRFEDTPGVKRSKGIRALVAVDESGSISDEDISSFYGELRKLERATRADIRVTRFDSDCTPPESLKAYVGKRTRAKQGGTDFRPIFRMADALTVPLVIVFTDGDGIYPPDSKQQVLWVLTADPKAPPPFGSLLKFTG